MLSHQSNLSLPKGNKNILIETSESASLVLIFSSWHPFNDARGSSKSSGSAFTWIQQKIKSVSKSIQINLYYKTPLNLEEIKVGSLYFISLYKLLQNRLLH